MHDLNTKYKDRTPEETITIVKNFFKQRQLHLELGQLQKNKVGTWGCTASVYYGNQLLFTQSGKGVTKEYAAASGCAEAYERFCNLLFFIENPFVRQKYLEKSFANNSFFYAADEKEVDIVKDIVNNPFFSDFINTVFGNNLELFTEWFTEFNNGLTYAIPFESILDGHSEYFNLPLLILLNGSTGMVAGNTKEEALVQGINEVFERKTNVLLFSKPQEQYYEVNQEILPAYLKTIIKWIEDDGFKLLVFDLSYNFQLPVCLCVLIDQETGRTRINFGAALNPFLAVERCITELYQNIYSYHDPYFNKGFNIPGRACSWDSHVNNNIHSYHRVLEYPEEILLKKTLVDKFNPEVFLINATYSNEFLLQQALAIAKKQNIDLLYRDMSLTKEIYALSIVGINCHSYDFLIEKLKKFSQEEKNAGIMLAIQMARLLKYGSNVYPVSQNFITNMIHDISEQEYTPITLYCMRILTQAPLNLYFEDKQSPVGIFNVFYSLVLKERLKNEVAMFTSRVFNPTNSMAPVYISIIIYINSGQYSIEELQNLFSIYNLKAKLDLTQNTLLDLKYHCLKQLFFIPLQAFIQNKNNFVFLDKYFI